MRHHGYTRSNPTCLPYSRLVYNDYAATVGSQPKRHTLLNHVPLLIIPTHYAGFVATGLGLSTSQDIAEHCTGVVGEVMSCTVAELRYMVYEQLPSPLSRCRGSRHRSLLPSVPD